jgi:hypothetical protein
MTDYSRTCFVFADGDVAGTYNVTMTQASGRPLKFRLDWKSAVRLQGELAEALGQMAGPAEKYFQK